MIWRDRVLVSGNEVRPHLPVAVPLESESLVDGPQLWSRCIAVQSEIPPPQGPCSAHGPVKKCSRYLPSRVTPPDCETMDESRVLVADIWPEQLIGELKLDGSHSLASTLRDKEKAGLDIPGDAAD